MVCVTNNADLTGTNYLNRNFALMGHFNESELLFENLNQEYNENFTTILCHHHYHQFSTNLQEIKPTEQILKDDNSYVFYFEVPEFKLHELMVKLTKTNILIVEGFKQNDSHEKNNLKNFQKYVMLPSDCDGSSVTSYLTSAGILKITAKKQQELSNTLESIDKLNL